MATDIHVGDVGLEIRADCQQDITGAVDIVFLVRKPDGKQVVWEATLQDGQYLVYITKTGDLDQPGFYKFHPRFKIGAWNGTCRFGSFYVKDLFQ